jgi:hypothetical protein
MGGAIQIRTGEYIPSLHAPILAGRKLGLAIAACKPPFRQQVAKTYAAAHGAACNVQFVALGQCEQKKPRVLEGDDRGCMKVQVGFVGLTQQHAGFQRSDPTARFDSETAAADESEDQEQAGQLRRLKIQFRGLEEKGRLARGFSAMPQYPSGVTLSHVAAVQLTNVFRSQLNNNRF